jgi:spore maturation protein SpmB
MRIAEKAGLVHALVCITGPLLRPLFPGIPKGHPAMGMVTLNLTANMLGLGNAATPFGIKAMEELQKLNKTTDTATNSMVMLLAMNTAGVPDPDRYRPGARRRDRQREAARHAARLPCIRSRSHFGPDDGGRVSMSLLRDILDDLPKFIIPLMLVAIPLCGLFKRVAVYEEFVTGAKEGFQVAVRIIPYLVAILFAIGMFRASGAMQYLMDGLRPILGPVKIPPEILPMAITRPLSGGGSLGILGDMVKTHGVDSPFVRMAGVMYGACETTFYVIAVYFGAVGIKRVRHAVAAGLIADVAGVLLAVYIVRWWFQ